MGFLKKIKNMFTSKTFKNVFQWLISILMLLGLALLLRSCYHQKMAPKSVYILARDSSWYSFELLGREKNLLGFTNDLIHMISNETGLRFQWMEASPNQLIRGLEQHSYDAILSSMRPNVVNQDKYDFSELLFQLGPVLLVNQDSAITSFDQLRNKTIGIRTGSNPIFNAIHQAGANAYDFVLFTYGNMNKALEALVDNQIDGVIMEALPAYSHTEGIYATKLKIVTAPLNDEGLRIIALTDRTANMLIDKINQALEKLKANGSYEALIQKWDLIDAGTEYKKHITTPEDAKTA